MTPQRACPLGTAAHGLALPTVLVLCMVCSVWLLAGWRNISLAQGWGQAHTQRWQLQQAALSALADLVSQVTLPAPSTPSTQSGGNPNTATPAWPSQPADWPAWQASLPAQGCRWGRCRSLLNQGNDWNDWWARVPQAQTRSDVPGLRIHTWVEIWPTANTLVTPSSTAPMPQNQSLTYRFTVLAQSTAWPTQSGWQAVWQSPATPSPTPTPLRLADMHRLLAVQP